MGTDHLGIGAHKLVLVLGEVQELWHAEQYGHTPCCLDAFTLKSPSLGYLGHGLGAGKVIYAGACHKAVGQVQLAGLLN